MSSTMSLETFLQKILDNLDELKLATAVIGNKEALREQLYDAKLTVDSMKHKIENAREDLAVARRQNIEFQNLIESMKNLNEKIAYIEKNLPEHFIKEFLNLNEDGSPFVNNVEAAATNVINEVESEVIGDISGVCMPTPQHSLENCKKILFKCAEDSYSMDPLSIEEFSKIPKYMIGRQTLATVNDFVSTINAILEAKYSLLTLGKVGARKKGKLDLYLSLKNEEINVGPGEDPVYFFTAEDYHRHTQMKLDKMKLNLLTVLRHCKRLKELRAGKNLRYILITSLERNK